MLERSAEIDDLAGRIFLAEHFCSRDIQAPSASEPVAEVRTWMALNDFDQAPLAGSNGSQVLLFSDLLDQPAHRCVGELARLTPTEHTLEACTPLRLALQALAERRWLLVRNGEQLIGILTRHDLASPVVTAYLLARLLGLEQGMRRLYGSFTHKPLPDEPAQPQEADDAFSLAGLFNRVARQPELRSALGFRNRNGFDDATGGLVALRNHLAHGRSILALNPEPRAAVARIQRLEELVAGMRQLLSDREHVWDAFVATEIVEPNEPARRVWAGVGAGPLPLPPPVHVVTAQNPREQVLSEADNLKRHLLLRDFLELHAPAAELREVLGRSTQGPWQEASWAIAGLGRESALAVAKRFQQRAIFELTATAVAVIDLDGNIRRQGPRRR